MKLVTSGLMDELVKRAGESPRLRTNHNVHEDLSDPVQRLFVASRADSYFRPHRHPEKWEFALVIKGRFDVLTFDDAGRVTERISVGPDADVIGFELPENTWHGWVPMEDGSVFFEVKQGPYDARTIAEFAPWSPEEGSEQAGAFASRIRSLKIGETV